MHNTLEIAVYVFFLFNRTILQVYVTYRTGALYVHPLWFYKHQHDNRVRSKLFVACQRWWFQWRFWFVPSVPGYVRYVTKTWSIFVLSNKNGHILLSQVYCVWQVVKTPTIISNNPVYIYKFITQKNIYICIRRRFVINWINVCVIQALTA